MRYALRQLCIENDYFTVGSCEQYEKMFEMAEGGSPAHDIALVIWICSTDASLSIIEQQVGTIINRYQA